MEIPQKLRDYLDSTSVSGRPVTDPDEPLHVDSLSFVRLIAFLETDLGIRLENDELIEENFATLRKLSELIAKKIPADDQLKTPDDSASAN